MTFQVAAREGVYRRGKMEYEGRRGPGRVGEGASAQGRGEVGDEEWKR